MKYFLFLGESSRIRDAVSRGALALAVLGKWQADSSRYDCPAIESDCARIVENYTRRSQAVFESDSVQGIDQHEVVRLLPFVLAEERSDWSIGMNKGRCRFCAIHDLRYLCRVSFCQSARIELG